MVSGPGERRVRCTASRRRRRRRGADARLGAHAITPPSFGTWAGSPKPSSAVAVLRRRALEPLPVVEHDGATQNLRQVGRASATWRSAFATSTSTSPSRSDRAPAPGCPRLARGVRGGARAHTAQAGAKLRPCHPEPDEKRGTERPERLLDREAADVRERHWKISVVQSPPWRRTSWARAGPSGRSWKSTKKSGSISMPPSGAQFDPQQPGAQLGIELVVPGRVERVGDVEPAAVERELEHLRAAVQLAAARRSACRARRRARAGRSASGWPGRRRRTGAGRRAASSRSRGSGRPSRARGR